MSRLSQSRDPEVVFHFLDDMTELNTTRFASTDDGATGTNAIAAAMGGIMNVVTAGADNDYHLMASGSVVELLTKKPVRWEIRLKLTEANVDDANIVAGLSDTVTTGFLANDGAGPPASYDGAVFFKVDGGTVWQFQTSNATAQVTNTSLGAFVSGAWTVLALEFDPGDGTTGFVTPFLNGVAGTPHKITLASLAAMKEIFGVKAGGANAETLAVDYVGVEGYR